MYSAMSSGPQSPHTVASSQVSSRVSRHRGQKPVTTFGGFGLLWNPRFRPGVRRLSVFFIVFPIVGDPLQLRLLPFFQLAPFGKQVIVAVLRGRFLNQ